MGHLQRDPEYCYFVNGQRYASLTRAITGAEVKARIPNVRLPYGIFVQHADGLDRLVLDTDRFPLDAPGFEPHFYTVPFAARARQSSTNSVRQR